MPRKVLFLLLCMTGVLHAAHIARFEVKEIEWNGTMKKYGATKKLEAFFTQSSTAVYIDSFSGSALFVRFTYVPVYSDHSVDPGFYAVVFDSNDRRQTLTSQAIYKAGMYDAGTKEKDQTGTRRWVGILKYIPDTSVHLPLPAWRSDHFTLMIESFQAWRDLKKGRKRFIKARNVRKLYFEGYTGVPSTPKRVGKIGKEKLDMVMDPVRYKWGNEVWFEFTIRLYSTKPNGKRTEILAHKFDSRNPDLKYEETVKDNAYEIRDSENVNYMLIRRVYVIPY